MKQLRPKSSTEANNRQLREASWKFVDKLIEVHQDVLALERQLCTQGTAERSILADESGQPLHETTEDIPILEHAWAGSHGNQDVKQPWLKFDSQVIKETTKVEPVVAVLAHIALLQDDPTGGVNPGQLEDPINVLQKNRDFRCCRKAAWSIWVEASTPFN